ncbi:MAG: hypothetical protein N2319_08115 [Candidatus Kapabacteria bacterium]|nr:hypothetical protein [Candidatus Kapabacteria bacterium]
MRKVFLIVTLMIFSALFSFSQDMTTIYSNLDIINNKIYNLSQRVTKLSNSIESVRSSNVKSIDKLKKDFEEILIDFNEIRILSQSMESVCSRMIEINDTLRNEIKDVRKENDALLAAQRVLRTQTKVLGEQIEYLNIKFNQVPPIFFCEDCPPKFSIGASAKYYPSLNVTNIRTYASPSMGISYKVSSKYGFWLDYTSPFIISLSDYSLQYNTEVSDQWTAHIISSGFFYHLNDLIRKPIIYTLGFGVFYGEADYDRYFTNDIGIERGDISGFSGYGVLFLIEASYNEFINKFPMELFVNFTGNLFQKKIKLNTGIGQPHDLGLFLVSASIGVRFNFWGK